MAQTDEKDSCIDRDVLEKYGSCKSCREWHEEVGLPTLCEISDGSEYAPIDLIIEGYGDDLDGGENQDTDEAPNF